MMPVLDGSDRSASRQAVSTCEGSIFSASALSASGEVHSADCARATAAKIQIDRTTRTAVLALSLDMSPFCLSRRPSRGGAAPRYYRLKTRGFLRILNTAPG